MIRKAEIHDLESVAKIYADIIAYEEQNTKYTAFQANVYPTRATAEKAYHEDSLFVYETDGEICASIIMNHIQPKEYRNVDWATAVSAEMVMVIHLLCVSPNKSGSGLGRKLVAFAIEEARKQNCKTIRLDIGSQNAPARHLYEKMGFIVAGTNHMSIGGIIPHSNHLFYELELTDKFDCT